MWIGWRRARSNLGATMRRRSNSPGPNTSRRRAAANGGYRRRQMTELSRGIERTRRSNHFPAVLLRARPLAAGCFHIRAVIEAHHVRMRRIIIELAAATALTIAAVVAVVVAAHAGDVMVSGAFARASATPAAKAG